MTRTPSIPRIRLLPALLASAATLLMVGCSDDAVTPDPGDDDPGNGADPLELTEEEAQGAVLDFLEEQGVFSSSYFTSHAAAAPGSDTSQTAAPQEASLVMHELGALPDDYVSSEPTDEGAIVIRMWVHADGDILPSSEWRQANVDYCANQGRYMRAPVEHLTVTIYRQTQEVFIRLVDVETGVIQEQRNGLGDGDFWLEEALEDGWNQMEAVEGLEAGDPCGRSIDLEMVFDSRIEYAVDDERIVSRVGSTVPLEFTGDRARYAGVATLEHAKYTNFMEEHGCTFEMRPGNLEGEVHFPDGRARHSEDLEVRIGIPTKDDFPWISHDCPPHFPPLSEYQATLWWPAFVKMHEEKLNEDERTLDFSGWEEGEDAWVIGTLSYHQSRTIPPPDGEGPPLTMIEETEIEVRHDGEG